MELDPLILSRIQFAFVVCFHAIFPVFTIGLASTIAGFETLYYKTKNPVWLKLSKFWTQVFAVVFGIGVVSGIVMSFQFGTNWSNFAYSMANFLGPVRSTYRIFLRSVFLRDFAIWQRQSGSRCASFCRDNGGYRHVYFVILDFSG
jgi:cytochrome d ubiquinol oxidase subunit I